MINSKKYPFSTPDLGREAGEILDRLASTSPRMTRSGIVRDALEKYEKGSVAPSQLSAPAQEALELLSTVLPGGAPEVVSQALVLMRSQPRAQEIIRAHHHFRKSLP